MVGVEDAEITNRDGDPRGLMQNTVCFHQAHDENRAIILYGRIRYNNPDFAFVLVNIAIIALKGGDTEIL